MITSFVLQDQFLDHFFNSVFGPDFYLTGGTALAHFYFHHRESQDLGLFTNNQGTDFASLNRLVLQIANSLQLNIVNQVTTDAFLQYIFHGMYDVNLKVDLVKDIPIHFGEIKAIGSVRLDSLENIGSNKVLAVFGRTDSKDFIDLYWLLHQTELKFDFLFDLALQKDLGLSEFYLAYALQNIQQIKLFPHMLVELPWGTIVEYYLELSRQLLLQIKPGK
jgi:predicted nucleotidyltransferase component of viral defense system